MKDAAAAYLIVVAVMSLACFIAYGLDKRKPSRAVAECPNARCTSWHSSADGPVR